MKLEDFLTREEGDDSRRLPDGCFASTWDPLGRCFNIGCGVTVGVNKDTVWTAEELQAHEEAELASVVAGVAKLVKVPLGENHTTVLASFAYNCGIGALDHSSILRSVNAGKLDDVPAELREYVHAKGAVGPVPGLVKRRNDEIRLWNTPDGADTPDLRTAKNVPAATSQTESDLQWLKDFQSAHGLDPDGDCGPITLKALRAALIPTTPVDRKSVV